MGTIINTNVQALNSQRSLKVVASNAEKSAEKLSSGQRINRAGDDAAGLAISEKMRNQIKGLNQASRNAQDGISMIQTAEGALQETHEMLKRVRELIVQASNDTNVSGDRGKIATEIEQLLKEIDSTAEKTEYNTKKLINGSAGGAKGANGGSIYLQVGANANKASDVASSQSIKFAISGMNVSSLKLNDLKKAVSGASKGVNGGGTGVKAFSAMGGASIAKFIASIDKAISNVSTQRAVLGAIQNRLEHTIKNLDTSSENLSASESRIRDTDMAVEMMNYTKNNVLTQAATNMLAQANQAPNNVLSLLG